MIPIEDTGLRTSLESWKGPALVTNLRTICGAPTMVNPAIEFIKDSNMTTGLQINSLTGTFKAGAYTLEKPERLLCEIDVGWGIKFPKSWPISICADQGALPELYFGGLRDSISNLHYKLNQVVLVNSSAQALNLLEKAQSQEGITEKIESDLAQGLTQIQDGLWTKLTHPNGSNVLSVTTCYINMLTPWVYNATMRGRRIGAEPVGNWSSINENGNNTNILHQLGVGLGPTEFQRRGVLSLDINILDSYLPLQNGEYNGLLSTMMSQHHPISQSAWSLWHERYRYNWENAWSLHASHASIFQAIIQETKDPAVAV